MKTVHFKAEQISKDLGLAIYYEELYFPYKKPKAKPIVKNLIRKAMKSWQHQSYFKFRQR